MSMTAPTHLVICQHNTSIISRDYENQTCDLRYIMFACIGVHLANTKCHFIVYIHQLTIFIACQHELMKGAKLPWRQIPSAHTSTS